MPARQRAAGAASEQKPFSELVTAELGLDATSGTVGQTWIERPPRQLFGLALSGGGIRSATFNLGLLQGLHELGFLRGFDYLATVSGGGYTGAFWTYWRKRHPSAVFPDRVEHATAEPIEIRHLRRFSRFLSPSLGVFSYDTGRMLVALVNAVVPSLLCTFAFLSLVLMASIAIAGFVLVAPGIVGTGWNGSSNLSLRIAHGAGAFAVMTTFGIAHLLAMRAMWKESIDRRRVVLMGVFTTALLSLLWALWVGLHPEFPRASRYAFQYLATCDTSCDRAVLLHPMIWRYALAPAAALLLVPAATAVLRVLDQGHAGLQRPLAAVVDQVNSWYMFAATTWIVLTLLWWTAFYLHLAAGPLGTAIKGIAIAGVPLAGVVTWLARFVGATGHSSESKGQRAGRLGVALAGYVILGVMVLGGMLAFINVQRHHWWAFMLLGTAAGILYVVLLYDPNRVGLHDFYRGRIARGFLGAAHPSGVAEHDLTEEQLDDDTAIADLPGPDEQDTGPLHLIVCAANNLTPSDKLSGLSRGAESAVLSPVGWSVGDQWTKWPRYEGSRPDNWKATSPRLSAAVTASGAAFNTQMGSKSKLLGPAMAFVMSSLGLRLGLWLRHPRLVVGHEPIVRRRRGFALVDELLGRSDSQHGEWVFLSDGGHFDNTGLYELIKRHCRFVLVSDCGADSERAFDDLGGAVRRVREDFGVDIKISLDALRPGENGLSRQPMVAGDIHYPDGDTGTLLVLKPSLIGSEPPDILQYRARNAKFPHQSTGDQFFDEAQWESYRRLGLHVARTALSTTSERHPTLSSQSPPKSLHEQRTANAPEALEALRTRMAREFGAARREWFARPADYAVRVDRLARMIGTLDVILENAGSRLASEVYWELPTSPRTARMSPAGLSTAQDHVEALSGLRQALVVFESIFLSEQLATQFNQPMYAGIMNLMARWMGAPLTRAWWPLLNATCGVAFRQFAEVQFMPNGSSRTLHLALAHQSINRDLASRHRDTPVAAESLATLQTLRLILTLPAEPDTVTDPLAENSVEVARLDASVSNDCKTMMWDARDLYVPPGLWGMGFGSALLAITGSAHSPTSVVPSDTPAKWVKTCWQVVFVRSFWNGTPEEKKDSANLQQLYLQAGFVNATKALFLEASVNEAYINFHARWQIPLPFASSDDDFTEHVPKPDFIVLCR